MFSIIVILSENNCIGKNGDLLWHLPEDLKRFKETTLNHKMIMGRGCFESLPGVLPKRKSIIATKNKEYFIDHKNVTMCYDLDKFILDNKDLDEEIFVIGGGKIYEKFLPYCKKLYLTIAYDKVEGDVYFPKIDFTKFVLTYEGDMIYNEKENINFKYYNYERV
ncbi:MAG: dihydrofolate reductase [Lachnospirales bacterium]